MVCQLRSCLARPVTCALMRSCFFACSASTDTGGQDGLRRDGRPSFAAHSADFADPVATSDACSSTPRTHQGTRRRQEGGCKSIGRCYPSSRHSTPLLPACPTEFGSIDPHAMQDDSEFAGKRHLSELHAAPFCDPHSPATQAGPASVMQEYMCCPVSDRLAKKAHADTWPSRKASVVSAG